MKLTDNQLKALLDDLYKTYDFNARIAYDPICIPKLYSRPEDIELSAFIASCLAYGKVSLFLPVTKKILSKMGSSPYEFVVNFDPLTHRSYFEGIYYRFNKPQDLIALISRLSRVLRQYRTLRDCFYKHYTKNNHDYPLALLSFVKELLGKATYSKGLQQLLPLPLKSPCKRLNLFMRWMVRDKDIDFGLWDFVPKDKLIIPLDTHICRIARCLGLTAMKSPSWSMAVKLTNRLRSFDSSDPLKYDFALCHQGIAQICSKQRCKGCQILALKG